MDNKTEDLLTDYLHGALDDADRAQLEEQLRSDELLRQQLTALRAAQRQMISGISAEIQAQAPPASMSFAAISADIQRRPYMRLRSRLSSSLVAFAALAILLFAVAYSLPDQNLPSEGNAATPPVLFEVSSTPTATPILSLTLTTNASSLPTRTPSSSIPSNSTIVTSTPPATPEANKFETAPLRVAEAAFESSTIPTRVPHNFDSR